MVFVDMQADVEMSSMYEQQAGSSEAQPLLPGSRPGPLYAPALPPPLPLAFPPTSGVAADVRLSASMM